MPPPPACQGSLLRAYASARQRLRFVGILIIPLLVPEGHYKGRWRDFYLRFAGVAGFRGGKGRIVKKLLLHFGIACYLIGINTFPLCNGGSDFQLCQINRYRIGVFIAACEFNITDGITAAIFQVL